MKGCDVIAVGANQRAAIVEVKTSQSARFVTGFYQKYKTVSREHPTFWVLYSTRVDGLEFEDRFFVLTHDELATVQAERNHPGEVLEYAVRAERVAKGVDNVLVAHVERHENAWEKIVRWCTEDV